MDVDWRLRGTLRRKVWELDGEDSNLKLSREIRTEVVVVVGAVSGPGLG